MVSTTCRIAASHHGSRGFLIDQLRVVDFTGRIIQKLRSDPTGVRPETIDAGCHQCAAASRYGSSRTAPPMGSAFAPNPNQTRGLQRLLHPRVVVVDATLFSQLLVKVPDIEIRVRLPIQLQYLLQLLYGHALGTRPVLTVIV